MAGAAGGAGGCESGAAGGVGRLVADSRIRRARTAHEASTSSGNLQMRGFFRSNTGLTDGESAELLHTQEARGSSPCDRHFLKSGYAPGQGWCSVPEITGQLRGAQPPKFPIKQLSKCRNFRARLKPRGIELRSTVRDEARTYMVRGLRKAEIRSPAPPRPMEMYKLRDAAEAACTWFVKLNAARSFPQASAPRTLPQSASPARIRIRGMRIRGAGIRDNITRIIPDFNVRYYSANSVIARYNRWQCCVVRGITHGSRLMTIWY
jgi:hypothetical protein